MAKKAVATLRSLDKTYSKIIRMKRSDKTGAYYQYRNSSLTIEIQAHIWIKSR